MLAQGTVAYITITFDVGSPNSICISLHWLKIHVPRTWCKIHVLCLYEHIQL